MKRLVACAFALVIGFATFDAFAQSSTPAAQESENANPEQTQRVPRCPGDPGCAAPDIQRQSDDAPQRMRTDEAYSPMQPTIDRLPRCPNPADPRCGSGSEPVPRRPQPE